MTDAELDAIRGGLQPIRAYIESPDSMRLDLEPLSKLLAASIYAHILLREVDRLRAERDRDHTGIHGAWCWLAEALGDAPDGSEPTAESLRLSAEALAKRITALADHLEGRPSDLDLGMYDGAGGSFGRVLRSTRQLLADCAAFVRADEARVDILEQIWTVLGGPTLPDDPHSEPPVSGDVEADALELARRVVAERDRLAARVKQLSRELLERDIADLDQAERKATQSRVDRVTGGNDRIRELEADRDRLQTVIDDASAYVKELRENKAIGADSALLMVDLALGPLTSPPLAHPTPGRLAARVAELEADRDRLAARVAELEGRPSVPPPSEKPACIPPETPV